MTPQTPSLYRAVCQTTFKLLIFLTLNVYGLTFSPHAPAILVLSTTITVVYLSTQLLYQKLFILLGTQLHVQYLRGGTLDKENINVNILFI